MIVPLLLALIFHTPAPDQVQPLKPIGKWNIDYGTASCTLSRVFEDGDRQLTLGFRYRPLLPDGATISMTKLGTFEWFPKQGQIALTILPAGAPLVSELRRAPSGEPSQGVEAYFKELRLADLAQGGAVRIKLSDRPSMDLAVPGIESGVKALQSCAAKLIEEWQIDPREPSAIRDAAAIKVSPGDVFIPLDYLPEARSVPVGGKTTMLLAVGVNGKARECRIVGSNGVPSVDRRACEITMARMQFRPAIGIDGMPVPSHMTIAVTWLASSELLVTPE